MDEKTLKMIGADLAEAELRTQAYLEKRKVVARRRRERLECAVLSLFMAGLLVYAVYVCVETP